MEIYVTETGKTAVAMVTDRAYFLPSVAAARSVVRHQNEPHDIFLFCHNFEPTRDEQSWLNVNIPQLTCVSIDLIDIFKPELSKIYDKNIMIVMLGRLALPKLLNNYQKILYIDGDILCLSSYDQYLKMDLNNFVVAAAHDNILWHLPDRPTLPRSRIIYRTDINVPLSVDYLNAGALIMNVSEWNKQQIGSKALELYARHHEKYRFVDQSALNALLQGQFLPLSPRFNYQEIYQGLDLENALPPVFVHFSGGYKPWSSAHYLYDARYRKDYETYLDGFPGVEHFLHPIKFSDKIFLKSARKALRRILTGKSPAFGVPYIKRKNYSQRIMKFIIDKKMQDLDFKI
jgi:lipopolysaccharide biosynthesis glycosyltransferase